MTELESTQWLAKFATENCPDCLANKVFAINGRCFHDSRVKNCLQRRKPGIFEEKTYIINPVFGPTDCRHYVFYRTITSEQLDDELRRNS